MQLKVVGFVSARACIFAALFGVVLGGSSAQAQSTYVWNDSGTAWATASDWSPSGPPGSLDVAEFINAVSYANTPNFGAGATVGGVWVTGAAALTITGVHGDALTLDGATVNSNAATGIEMDPGAGALSLVRNTVLACRKPG